MWTNHEIERLKQSRAGGMSQPELAKVFGRSRRSVASMCFELVRAGAIPRISTGQRSKIAKRARKQYEL
jgi:transposase